MSTRKLTAEEEIDKQYREHKANFEKWKESNKNSIGTDAYDDYVQKFQAWEQDVEKRKAALRQQKAETAEQQSEEDAAKAYAQQEHYIRMHQKAIAEETIRNRLSTTTMWPTASPSARAGGDMASVMTGLKSMIQSAMKPAAAVATNSPGLGIGDTSSPLNGLKSQNLGGGATISAPPLMAAQQAPAIVEQQVEAERPPLWWCKQPEYDQTDPLFSMFGIRAAPTTSPTSHLSALYTPAWFVQTESARCEFVINSDPEVFKLLPPPQRDWRPLPATDGAPPKVDGHLTEVPDFSKPPPPIPAFNPLVPPPAINPSLIMSNTPVLRP